MPFAPKYVTHVLAPQRILSVEEAHVLRVALDSVSIAELRAVQYDGTCL